jgi:hypothetical protein
MLYELYFTEKILIRGEMQFYFVVIKIAIINKYEK